ncbi:putative inosine/uridine-preferring nucleoside hydrolase domain, ribonucleoside hydrolase [Dioscorea sansibarensis]
MQALNQPQQSARFNHTSQLPYQREILHKPSYKHKVLGKPVVFDMDMSVGDLVALIYLLKVPVEEINIKGILVNGNGWANAATVDIVYDVLHMMGRDDIPVGLGSFTALGTPTHSCKYVKSIPHGSGGLIDSDTLFGLARNLPQSPRRYTVEDDRQPSAMEVWQMISRSIDQNNTINILTNGPLTNIANIILSDENASSVIQRIYILGGHIIEDQEKGNVFTNPSNEYAEFNMFLDPLAAKTVIESKLDVTLIPLDAQRKVTSFGLILKQLQQKLKTSESVFVHHLLSRLHNLKKRHKAYNHMDIFLGEILGAVFMVASDHLNPIIKTKPVNVLAGNVNTDGQIVVNEGQGKIINVLESLDPEAYYNNFAKLLGVKKESAVIGSFAEQKKMWRMPPNAS